MELAEALRFVPFEVSRAGTGDLKKYDPYVNISYDFISFIHSVYFGNHEQKISAKIIADRRKSKMLKSKRLSHKT